MQVCSEYNLNILIVVFNNQSYDSIQQWSKLTTFELKSEIKNVNFAQIANGFGIKAQRVYDKETLNNALSNFKWNETLLLELMVPSEKVECHFP